MRLFILSHDVSLHSIQRLVESGRLRGHEVEVIDPVDCALSLSGQGPQLQHKGVPLADPDAVIARVAASSSPWALAVLRQFELRGVQVCNRADAIERARNKWRCHQVMAAAGLPMPATVAAVRPQAWMEAAAVLGAPPQVIKLNESSQGCGVMLAESASGLASAVDTLSGLRADFLVQQFVPEADASDLRVIVVGGKAVAAMRRRAQAGDFRSNLHQGGSAEAVELQPDWRACAERAALAIGLDVAGVDLLTPPDGPLVLEVNAAPGLQGIEAASGLDVAGLIIGHVEAVAARAAHAEK